MSPAQLEREHQWQVWWETVGVRGCKREEKVSRHSISRVADGASFFCLILMMGCQKNLILSLQSL